jgi:hypothetical protein
VQHWYRSSVRGLRGTTSRERQAEGVGEKAVGSSDRRDGMVSSRTSRRTLDARSHRKNEGRRGGISSTGMLRRNWEEKCDGEDKEREMIAKREKQRREKEMRDLD